MNHSPALAVFASGLALLALALTILPFQARLAGLIDLGYWAGLETLRAPVVVAVILSLLAAAACSRWRHPAAAVLLLTVALGTAAATAVMVALPRLLSMAPARIALMPP